MEISNDIINLINKTKLSVENAAENSNLYSDLGYNSLSFVCLLLKIEERYSIKFELSEMSKCLSIKYLILLVKQKLEKGKQI